MQPAAVQGILSSSRPTYFSEKQIVRARVAAGTARRRALWQDWPAHADATIGDVAAGDTQAGPPSWKAAKQAGGQDGRQHADGGRAPGVSPAGEMEGPRGFGGGLAGLCAGGSPFFSQRAAWPCLCLSGLGRLLWRPVAWLRRSAAVFLLGLAAEWGMTTLALARWRLQLGQDWLRMVCILGAVAALTLLAAAALRSRACRRGEVSGPRAQALACLLVSALLLLLDGLRPDLLLLHRLVPGWGAVQALLAGLWAGLVYGWLADRRRASVWRRRIWLLFSCVFFGQLLAGLFLHSLFLLQGVPHLPVPGLILSCPLYRGGGSLFMPGLFAVSLLLAGSAWCSHLCYLGVWDARAADTGPRSGRGVPALWRKMRWGLLAVSLLLPFGGPAGREPAPAFWVAPCRAAVALGPGPCAGAGAGPVALCPLAEPEAGHPGVLLRHLPAGDDGQPAGASLPVASAPERALHGMRGLCAGLPIRRPAAGRGRQSRRPGLALHPVPGLHVRLPS